MSRERRDQEERINISGLKDRGWTDGLIRKHLGEPDHTAPNPYYTHAGAPMRLYDRARVEAAERTEAVRQDLKKVRKNREARTAAAEKAAETRREQLLDKVEATPITVRRLPAEKVRHLAFEHNRLNPRPSAPRDNESEEAFEARVIANFLRHQCTNYDEELYELVGQVGRDDAYRRFRARIEEALEEAYPEFFGGPGVPEGDKGRS